MKKNKIALGIVFATISSGAFAHGYISANAGGVAEGRATLCKYPAHDTGEKNTNCGQVQWEPQSVEGAEGFPNNEAGVPDGQIASGGLGQTFGALDEQTADRWVKRPMSSGKQTFEWTFTAPHVTRDWQYFITKQDWNPNAPLSRDSLVLTPFCVVDGGMVAPPKVVTHECDVPERTGYQVIVGVWDIGDTGASFYQVIDAQFDGSGPTPPVDVTWTQSATITPLQNLKSGDAVYTRVFVGGEEASSLSTRLDIASADQGMAKNWAHGLASKINQEQSLLKAGTKVSDDEFKPVFGANPIYVKKGSNITAVELKYEMNAPAPTLDFEAVGLEKTYLLTDGPLELTFEVTSNQDTVIDMTVYNHDKESLAHKSSAIAKGEYQSQNLTLSETKPGHHMLVLSVKTRSGEFLSQKTYDFMVVEEDKPTPPTPPTPGGEYDFVFPEGIDTYTEGTKVLAEDGSIYQCKAFPYSGYCVQWSPSARQYEPGFGYAWEMAWDKVN